MGAKISIAEARIRRTDPLWRRRHKTADILGAVLGVLVVLVPVAAALLAPALAVVVAVAVLATGTAAVATGGPAVGFERRAAVLVVVPVVGLVILFLATWRGAHLHLQHWQGPLEPQWDENLWLAASAAAAVSWLGLAALLGLSLT